MHNTTDIVVLISRIVVILVINAVNHGGLDNE